MKRCLCSAYLKKKTVPATANKLLEDDLALFNEMRICGFVCKNRGIKGEKSFHVSMKEHYGTNDYFVTAVEGAIEMTRSSQEELIGMYIADMEQDIADMKKKLTSIQARRENLLRMKESLAAYTKTGGKNPSLIRNFQSSGISFQGGAVRVGTDKHFHIYPNIYLFEHQYLEPKIRRLKSAASNVTAAIRRKGHRLEKFRKQEETGVYSVCFGSRRLMRGTGMPREQREKEFRLRRRGRMTLSGRLDAAMGNFMVHYDPESHVLAYRGSGKSREYKPVGKVEFPYGQELLDGAIKAGGTPIAWTVVDCGNAWRFDACVTLPDCSLRGNNYYGDGCVAMDVNSDRIAVVELDGHGCPRRREVIPLKLEGSTRQNEQEISLTLERVFQTCRETRKPLAAEDIGAVKRKAGRYSTGQKRNRSISMFASSRLRELTESKSFKYGIGVTFVNPAYITQTGKFKYMKHYGFGIHESAALAVGRRAMGYAERLPAPYYKSLTCSQKARPRTRQWKAAYKRMAEVTRKQILTGEWIPA